MQCSLQASSASINRLVAAFQVIVSRCYSIDVASTAAHRIRSHSCTCDPLARSHTSYKRSFHSTASSPSHATVVGTSQSFPATHGLVKIQLHNPSLIGVAQSRGERPYQEDAYAISSLSLPSNEITRALDGYEGVLRGKDALEPIRPSVSSNNASGSHRDAIRRVRTSKERLRDAETFKSEEEAGPGAVPGDTNADADEAGPDDSSSPAAASAPRKKTPFETLAAFLGDSSDGPLEQVACCAVFDGHGGSHVSTYLQDKLYSHILQAAQVDLEQTMTSYRKLGGYLRRYRGGILSDFVSQPLSPAHMRRLEDKKKKGEDTSRFDREMQSKADPSEKWSLHHRIHAAFLETDLAILKEEEKAGSVATLCLLHSLPPLSDPHSAAVPFYSAKRLHLLTAHLGDTRALLCTATDSSAIPLTETHHPDARSETDRLMRIRTGAVADSFGETRWAGTLANTRGFGDGHYKALGVFAEPAITSRIIDPASSAAFVVMVSDGVTDSMSDQEVVDLVRSEKRPDKAAKTVVSFAESVGADDNITCIVIPLPGWGTANGEDTTKARRDFRLANFENTSNRSRRM